MTRPSISLKILFVLIFYSTFSHSQTNYSTIGNGDFDDCTIWTVTCPPDPLPFGDSIFLNHVINLTGNIDISGVMVIGSGGEINGNKNIKIDPSGTIINNGRIDIQKDFHNDGSWYNNGYMHSAGIHNDGYICNTDTIEIDIDEEFDNHGGTIECGGLIIACEFKTHNNGGAAISGLSETDICCLDGSNPIIDYQDGLIDSNTVSVCGVNLFGILLPIELLSFEVSINNQMVINNWKTVSELNNDFFIISRSTDGITYEKLGTINGSGISSSLLNYEFIDYRPKFGTSYYKLTQVDFHGKSIFIGVKSVFIPYTKNIIIYPSPTNNDLNIKFNSKSCLNIIIKVNNIIGEVVYLNQEKVIIGTNNYLIDVNNFPKGIYFINIIGTKNPKLIYKFIKN